MSQAICIVAGPGPGGLSDPVIGEAHDHSRWPSKSKRGGRESGFASAGYPKPVMVRVRDPLNAIPRAPSTSSIPRPSSSRASSATPRSWRTLTSRPQPSVVNSSRAGQVPNGRSPLRKPGTKIQLVAKPPPNWASLTQWPAVQASVCALEATTVAEQR